MIICGMEVSDKDIDRLYDKFQICEDGCWRWTANRTSYRKRGGYGGFWFGKIRILAHRFVYEWLRGPIPDGMQLDHLCKNTLCVNPDHLEIVTPKENTLRGSSFAAVNASKTHCPKGHELSEENLLKRNSGRSCKLCHRLISREWARKSKNYNPENYRV